VTNNLIGLIPAAGKGLRLRLPYPKELYPIIRENRYKPVSQYVLESLTASGVEHTVFVINETKHQLIGYFGDGNRFDCVLSYVVQEKRENDTLSKSPGLAHALNSAYHLIRGKTVCFGMADTIMTPKDVFRRLLGASSAKDEVVLGVFPSDHPEKGAQVCMEDGGVVTKIIDKPKEIDHKHTWGCIIWKPKFTEFLNDSLARGETDFAEVMNLAIQAGFPFRGIYLEDGNYSDIGTYDEILELERKHGILRW
jgi:glucose-1-phosphate thymidylyltransferase